MRGAPSATTGLSTLLALVVLLAGCASAPRTAAPDAAPDLMSLVPDLSAPAPAPAPIPARLTLDEANDVTLYAISLVGTPYVRGGNTPDTGFDCSGLIAHVYQARARLKTPRTVAALRDWGVALPTQELRTGDLVLFTAGGEATHAGIYVGEGRFVHAPSTGGVVRLDRLNSPYWSRQQVSFRRP